MISMQCMHPGNMSLQRDGFAPPKLRTIPRPPSVLEELGIKSANSEKKRKHKPTFPEMVYRILEESEREGTENIVAWVDNGTSFHINKPVEFNNNILPKYTNKKTLFRSFQRQLNIYGFKMTKKSGVYHHELFRRGEFRSILQIRPRTALKKKISDGDENDDESRSCKNSRNMPVTPLQAHRDNETSGLQTSPASFRQSSLLRSISFDGMETSMGKNLSICSDEDMGGPVPFGTATQVASLGNRHFICSPTAVPGEVCFDLFDDMEGINYCTCNGCGCCFA